MSETKRFTIISPTHFRDNWVYTDETGAKFQREYIMLNDGKAVDQRQAVELAAACQEDGGGWALIPSPHEALPLISYDHYDPAVHQELREIVTGNDSWLWTAQVDPSASGCAFYVDLYSGYVYWSGRRNFGLVVACRRVSPPSVIRLLA